MSPFPLAGQIRQGGCHEGGASRATQCHGLFPSYQELFAVMQEEGHSPSSHSSPPTLNTTLAKACRGWQPMGKHMRSSKKHQSEEPDFKSVLLGLTRWFNITLKLLSNQGLDVCFNALLITARKVRCSGELTLSQDNKAKGKESHNTCIHRIIE